MLHNLIRRLPNVRRPPSGLFFNDPVSEDADVKIRYLGTAGFVVEGDGRTLVIDPYVSRPGIFRCYPGRVLPNEPLIRQILPVADDVLIGHAHLDHVLDGPSLCRQTGARFIGSNSACKVARAYGLPESQILATQGHETIASGDARLRGLPSRHGKVLFGKIPYPGEIADDFRWPARTSEFRHGQVLNWHIEIAGVSIVHIDSADYYEHELEGISADVLCLCAIGRQYRPGYAQRAITLLQPSVVIPCHWDNFFRPFHREPRLLLGVDLPGFVAEIRGLGATPVVLPFDGRFGFASSKAADSRNVNPSPREESATNYTNLHE